MFHFALFETFPSYLTDTAALAAVALIGYLFGQRSRRAKEAAVDPMLNNELARASQIACELQQVASRIRRDVARHQENISQFTMRLSELQLDPSEARWTKLCSEAESLLAPTMELATELTLAYDQLRRQTTQLMNFAGSRSDPVTGLQNRRAMEEQLQQLFTLYEKNRTRFSLALFSVQNLAPGEATTHYCNFAEKLQKCVRETDVVARYSTDEFIVLMPQTSLTGATTFSERMMHQIQDQADFEVAGGIVEVHLGDNPEKMLSRADSALYSARTAGQNCLYLHNGKSIRQHELTGDAAVEPASLEEAESQPMEQEAGEEELLSCGAPSAE